MRPERHRPGVPPGRPVELPGRGRTWVRELGGPPGALARGRPAPVATYLMTPLPVLYDFASTICFVAHREMDRMAPELLEMGVELVWRPIDLARITGWPRRVEVTGPRRENALRVAREFGVDVRMPAFWLDSRAAHAVALSLGKSSRAAAWRERVWSAVFEEGRDIGDRGEIGRLARDLDVTIPEELPLARLEADTDAARELGVDGAPTFLLGRYPFPGIQSRDTMRDAIRRWLARRSDPEA